MVLAVLASVIVAWFSRRREFKADQAGAYLASPAAMISALASLKLDYEQHSERRGELVAYGIRRGCKLHVAS